MFEKVKRLFLLWTSSLLQFREGLSAAAISTRQASFRLSLDLEIGRPSEQSIFSVWAAVGSRCLVQIQIMDIRRRNPKQNESSRQPLGQSCADCKIKIANPLAAVTPAVCLQKELSQDENARLREANAACN